MTAPASAGSPIRSEAARRVAICIATYRRPRMLGALLDSLADLQCPEDWDLIVVIVDNDADRSAEASVESRSATGPKLHYLVEPQRNISLARNRGIAFARESGAQLIALIDDDETARPDWLVQLVDTRDRFEADAVCGPVIPRFEEPGWIARAEFFSPHHIPTGSRIDFGVTNNALVDAGWLSGEPFAPEFGVSGGGDAHFFMRIVRDGAKVVWSEQAVVEELIPRSRATSRWVLSRAFRIGHAYVRCRRSLFPLWSWLPATLGGALARIAVGTLRTMGGILQGRRGVLRGLRTVLHGMGTLAALTGLSYQEYKRIHGS